jgi:Tfp pilus assembly protein PilN
MPIVFDATSRTLVLMRSALMKFGPVRLAVVLLGDRLSGAVVQQNRVDTFVIEAENPAAALRAELDARGLAPKNVAIGLARAAVVVKPIDLPPIVGEMREMVRFELDRHLPFPADDAPFDFHPLPPEGEPGEPASDTKRVLLAAADRRVVDTALRLAEEAKLRPVSITVAAHDLLALVKTARHQRVVWVHRCGDTADVLLLNGATLVVSRSVPATDEAELAAEARRSFGVARWRECDAVWVSGDQADALAGALLPLDAPVTRPPYTPRAEQRLASITEEPRGARELALAVASGRGVRPLDLISPALRPRRLTRPQWITVGMLAATVVLAIAALLVPGYREHRQLSALNREITRIDSGVRSVERILAELERKRHLLVAVQNIEAGAIRPLPVLRELTEILPADAWLTMLSLDPKGVELTGQAAQASGLIPVLENSPLLERVEFASPVTRGRDKEQFRIRAAWEAGRPALSPPAMTRPGRDEADAELQAPRGSATPPRPVPGTPPGAAPGARRR